MLVDRPLSTHIKPLFLGKWLYQGGRRFLSEYQSHHSFSLWSFKYLHLLVTHSHKSSQSSWKRLKLSEANHGSEIRRLLVIAPIPSCSGPASTVSSTGDAGTTWPSRTIQGRTKSQKWCQDGCSQLHFTSNQYRQFRVFGLRVRRLWGSLGLGCVKLLSGSLWT